MIVLGAGSVVGDNRLPAVRVDLDELAVLVHLDAVPSNDLLQDGGELRDAQDAGGGQNEQDADVVQVALLVPVVGGEVGDLLSCSGALDRAGRHGEHCGAGAHALDQLPGLGGELVAVVRGDGRREQRVGHAGDLAPVELDAGADDEVVVADALPARGRDGLRFGVDALGAVLDPVNAGGHH